MKKAHPAFAHPLWSCRRKFAKSVPRRRPCPTHAGRGRDRPGDPARAHARAFAPARDAIGHVLVDSPVGTVVDIGPRGFGILALFSEPRALGAAITALERASGAATDFAPTMSVINMLLEEGVLVEVGTDRPVTSGWADPVEHPRMLHDDRRTGDYIAALPPPSAPMTSCSTSARAAGPRGCHGAAGARHVRDRGE